MLVLGIETSCDETAVAVARRGENDLILQEGVKSQIPLHARYGGVVPEIASRNHYEVIDLLTRAVLKKAGLTVSDIELIALTQGPGLLGALLIGLSFAKGLALSYRIPLVAVDHILAHVESAFISNPAIQYPLVALVVSGGHTSLFYQKEKFDVQVIAKTRDDAAGEIMDKIAKYFNLGYPGGPILDQLYPRGDPEGFIFSMPRMSDKSNDFSFSGYKTAFLRLAHKRGITRESKGFNDLLSSFLNAIVDYLLSQTMKVVADFAVGSLIVAGGVSRNTLLRKRFQTECQQQGVTLFLPEPQHCTDNAAMVCWLGYETYKARPKADHMNLYLNSYSRFADKRNKKFR